jgi:hypothetical protein
VGVQQGDEHDRYVEDFRAHGCDRVEGFVRLGVEQELLAQRGEALLLILGLSSLETNDARVSAGGFIERAVDA